MSTGTWPLRCMTSGGMDRDVINLHRQNHHHQGSNRLHAFLLGDLFANLGGRHERTRRSRCKVAGATALVMAEARADDRRDGSR